MKKSIIFLFIAQICTLPLSAQYTGGSGQGYAMSNSILNEILPVVWQEFKGIVVDNTVHLSWVTSSEIDNNYFNVQKSQDGVNFTTFGKVQGSGTIDAAREYQFADQAPVFGMNYYRLKQVDYDGSFEYSSIVPVQFNMFINARAYPNPAKDQFTVEIAEEDVWFEMFNATGRQETIEMEIRGGKYRFSTHHLAKGLYFLKVHTPVQEETVKVVIE